MSEPRKWLDDLYGLLTYTLTSYLCAQCSKGPKADNHEDRSLQLNCITPTSIATDITLVSSYQNSLHTSNTLYSPRAEPFSTPSFCPTTSATTLLIVNFGMTIIFSRIGSFPELSNPDLYDGNNTPAVTSW